MKKAEIQIGSSYVAKIGGRLTLVQIRSVHSLGGWAALNLTSLRVLRIRSAAKLRRLASADEYYTLVSEKGARHLRDEGSLRAARAAEGIDFTWGKP